MQCHVVSCKGMIEPLFHSYKDFLMIEKEKCSACNYIFHTKANKLEKFYKEIDLILEMISEDSETFESKTAAREQDGIRYEEVISQAILQKAMPGYKIVSVDVGDRDNLC